MNTKYKEIINFIEELERKEVAQSIIKSLEQAVSKESKYLPTWTLSEVEYESANKFVDKHRKCFVNRGLGSNNIEYIFCHVGVGNLVKIRCSECGEEEDISDTGSW